MKKASEPRSLHLYPSSDTHIRQGAQQFLNAPWRVRMHSRIYRPRRLRSRGLFPFNLARGWLAFLSDRCQPRQLEEHAEARATDETYVGKQRERVERGDMYSRRNVYNIGNVEKFIRG